MQVLFFSDIHLHTHKRNQERLEDGLKVLEWVFDTARKNKIKNVIFLGDLFHDRNKIQVYAYVMTYLIFKKNSDINVFALLGNHDLWFYEKCDISSVFPFQSLPNVTVIDKICSLDISGVSFDFLPFTTDPISAIKNFKNSSDFLCSHIAVDGAVLNSSGNISDIVIESDSEMTKVSSDIFHRWKKVFLGHYHCSQELDEKTEYIGSPYQIDFGEANQAKNILIFDTETFEKKYIQNDFSPKHYIIKSSDVDNYSLSGSFVKIEIDDESDLVETKEKIRDVKSLDFFKKKKIEKTDEKLQVRFDLANGDALERWMKTEGNYGLDEELLIKIGRGICSEN